MHPQASTLSCNGRVIDAHSIQRKGPIARIVSAKNHVSRLEPSKDSSTYIVNDIGWKRASTFPGYCSTHDSQLFRSLEKTAFSGNHEHCVLQAFRNICNELYRKRALLESFIFQRDRVDLGFDLDRQINFQMGLSKSIDGTEKSIEEMSAMRDEFEYVVTCGEYDRFKSAVFFFEGDLSIISSSALHAEYDFSGEKLIDLWDLSLDAQILSHSVLNTHSGGAIIFTWLAVDNAPAKVVSSFEAIADADKGDIFVQYCFLQCENTYFSRSWWDSLETPLKNQLKQYTRAFYYEGGAFVANDVKLVNWRF